MSIPERSEKEQFNHIQPMAIDLTIEQASDHLPKYQTGGEYFEEGVTNRVENGSEGVSTQEK